MLSYNAENLRRFMWLFGAIDIKILFEDSSIIRARCEFAALDPGEPDEDVHQDVEWTIQADLDDALTLAEAAKADGVLEVDRLTQPATDLVALACRSLAWDSGRAQTALDQLLRVRVDMVDGETKSDHFFLHL